MVASIEARAERRRAEFTAKGQELKLDDVIRDLTKRDHLDSNRAESPLVKPLGAIELDTSNLSIDEQVEEIIKMYREKVR